MFYYGRDNRIYRWNSSVFLLLFDIQRGDAAAAAAAAGIAAMAAMADMENNRKQIIPAVKFQKIHQ